MSVEAPMGGLGVGIAAVPIAAGISSSVSIESSMARVGSPSFTANEGPHPRGFDSVDIFKDTAPLIAETPSVSEKVSPDLTSEIFSKPDNLWNVVAKNEPKSILENTRSFVAYDQPPERAIKINPGEWSVIAKPDMHVEIEEAVGEIQGIVKIKEQPEIISGAGDEIVDKIIAQETVFQTPKLEVKEIIEEMPDVETAVLSHAEKYLETEFVQAEKVIELYRGIGLSEDEISERISPVLEDKGLTQDSVQAVLNGKSKVAAVEEVVGDGPETLEEETAPEELAEAQAGVVDLNKVNKKQEKKVDSISEKLDRRGFDLDGETQNNRKKDAQEKIAVLFKGARENNAETVSGGELANTLSERPELRSKLLDEAGVQFVPDGSYDEAVKNIQGMGKMESKTEDGEDEMKEVVDEVFEANRPVRIIKDNTRKVTKKEVDKVLKFAPLQANPGVFIPTSPN